MIDDDSEAALGPHGSKDSERLSELLLDAKAIEGRDTFLGVMQSVIADVDDWFAVDSWLEANGQGGDPASGMPASAARAASVVVSMSRELVDGAVTMRAEGRTYALSALLRQLIECEYLLVLFGSDIEEARTWRESSADELRRTYQPGQMRKKLPQFANEEYWNHCRTGGHPNPAGAEFLERHDPRRENWRLVTELVAVDMGFHLNRVWRGVDRLLSENHSRYASARSGQRQTASDAWAAWPLIDPAAPALMR